MNLSNINAVVFKTAGLIISGALLILAAYIALHHLFVKAGIALVSAAIAGMLNGSKPTFMSWCLLLGTLLITVNIVHLTHKL